MKMRSYLGCLLSVLLLGAQPSVTDASDFVEVIYKVTGYGAASSNLNVVNFRLSKKNDNGNMEDGFFGAPEHALDKMTNTRKLQGVDCFFVLPASEQKPGGGSTAKFVVGNQTKGANDDVFLVDYSSKLTHIAVKMKKTSHVVSVSYFELDGNGKDGYPNDRKYGQSKRLKDVALSGTEHDPEWFCAVRNDGVHKHEHSSWPPRECYGKDSDVCAELHVLHGDYKHCNIGGNRIVHCGY